MKPDKCGCLGVEMPAMVYETVAELDKAATSKEYPNGRPGACLDLANNNLWLRGGGRSKAATAFVNKLVELTGFKRAITKAAEPAKDGKAAKPAVYESDNTYMNRFDAEADKGTFEPKLSKNEEQRYAQLQLIADKLGPFALDASVTVRDGTPKKVPTKWVETAKAALDKDGGKKALAALAKDSIPVAPFGTDAAANIDSLARAIWARELANQRKAEEERAKQYA